MNLSYRDGAEIWTDESLHGAGFLYLGINTGAIAGGVYLTVDEASRLRDALDACIQGQEDTSS